MPLVKRFLQLHGAPLVKRRVPANGDEAPPSPQRVGPSHVRNGNSRQKPRLSSAANEHVVSGQSLRHHRHLPLNLGDHRYRCAAAPPLSFEFTLLDDLGLPNRVRHDRNAFGEQTVVFGVNLSAATHLFPTSSRSSIAPARRQAWSVSAQHV